MRVRKRKYATSEEAKAAAKAQQAAYRAARKAGSWVRKNRVLSARIAAKAGVPVGFDPKVGKLNEKTKTDSPADSHPEEQAPADMVDARCGRQSPKRESREERRRRIKEKYGFDIRTPSCELTPEEIESRKRWLRDEEAEYRNRNRERITIYNREYRKRKRAEAFADRQRTWTAEEWAKWREKEEAKGRGKPERFVKDVVRVLAVSGKMTVDEVINRLLESGGVEFLVSGAEAIGKDRAKTPKMVKAAARAVAFYIDPEGAVMFPEA